jgi:hypothetical protein
MKSEFDARHSGTMHRGPADDGSMLNAHYDLPPAGPPPPPPYIPVGGGGGAIPPFHMIDY